MATTETAPEEQTVVEEHEKDVVITAYSDGEFEDKREFIDAVLGEETGIDVLETHTVEDQKVELKLSLEGESRFGTKTYEEKISPFVSSDKDVVVDALEGEELPEWMTLTNTTVEDEVHDAMLTDPLDEFIKNHTEASALDDLGYEHSDVAYTMSWSKEVEDVSVDADEGDVINHDIRFSTRSSGVDKRQVLVHQSDRTKENQYETENELWSFEIRSHLEAESAETLDEVSDRLIPDVYEALFGLDGISSVRLTSCEQNVSRVGECYNF